MSRAPWPLLSLAPLLITIGNAAESAIDVSVARQHFQTAREICQADGGKLWGVSLCGPILIVDPESRAVVANRKDSAGVLTEDHGIFVGVLPDSVNVANTPTEWSGTLWSQFIWPLPDEAKRRHTFIAHELFHRIQSKVAVPRQSEAANDHLDSLEGRYWMQLEWRALSAALRCESPPKCREAITDALLFRAARYRLCPSAQADERALELNEGIAEYTGVKLGNRTPADQLTVAVEDTSMLVGRSFVRSFAYATGAPYGLLLDRYSTDWKRQLQSGSSPSELLKSAAAISLAPNIADAAKERATAYDGVELRRAEEIREADRQRALAANRRKFVDGPVLGIPLEDVHMNLQFNPQTLQPLDKAGTVYPTLRVTADWGVLEVERGALVNGGWTTAYVAAPTGVSEPVSGDGWKLSLTPNWKVVPGKRNGDFQLTKAP